VYTLLIMNQPNYSEPERANPLFVVLYLLVLAVVLFYVGYLVLHFDAFGEQELVDISYYFVPAIIFSIIGIMTVRSGRSVIYALCSIPVTFVLMVYFFQTIWPSL
jgi:hypothetical protein